MRKDKTCDPDRIKSKLIKVSDHLRQQNETLKKMLGELTVENDPAGEGENNKN